MKYVVLTAFFLVSCAAIPLEFSPIQMSDIRQSIELDTVDDMERLVQQHKIKVVYYTPEYFVVDINSVFYLLKSRGYKNFHDYKEGRLAGPEEHSIFKPGYPLKRNTPRQ